MSAGQRAMALNVPAAWHIASTGWKGEAKAMFADTVQLDRRMNPNDLYGAIINNLVYDDNYRVGHYRLELPGVLRSNVADAIYVEFNNSALRSRFHVGGLSGQDMGPDNLVQGEAEIDDDCAEPTEHDVAFFVARFIYHYNINVDEITSQFREDMCHSIDVCMHNFDGCEHEEFRDKMADVREYIDKLPARDEPGNVRKGPTIGLGLMYDIMYKALASRKEGDNHIHLQGVMADVGDADDVIFHYVRLEGWKSMSWSIDYHLSKTGSGKVRGTWSFKSGDDELKRRVRMTILEFLHNSRINSFGFTIRVKEELEHALRGEEYHCGRDGHVAKYRAMLERMITVDKAAVE